MRAKWRGDAEDYFGYEQHMWRKRIVSMSMFLSDEDKSVMDLGAGSMHLRQLLNPDVVYYPVDYKKNAVDTIVCDFNKKEFPNISADVIVAAGILEYMEFPYWFLETITKHCKKLILSYRGKEKFSDSVLSTNEIISYLAKQNFIMTRRDFSLSNNWTLIASFERFDPCKLHQNQFCTGCGACANACPTNALLMDYDSDGFLKPYCDQSKCILCNCCNNACPIESQHINTNLGVPMVYAAWAPDDIREKSSSGGVFSVIANEVISLGGVVFGATWDERYTCHHVCSEKIEDIEKLRHSKYVQSNTQYSFREVKQALKLKKRVLYVGCPCQIAGLKNYLGTESDNELLLTIDLVCFCAPSNKLFQKYLDETFGIENVKNVTFRDKHANWSPYGYMIELNDGTVIYPNHQSDAYQKAFHNVLARNEVCERCMYTDFPRQGDMTLGDFWGIDRFDASWNDGKGTSLVYLNSEKSVAFFQELVQKHYFKRVKEVPFAWSRNNGNRIGIDGRSGSEKRLRFQRLVKKMDFESAVSYAIEDKYDIGLSVVFNRNIGNNLTNFALYNVLRDLDKEVLIIDAQSEGEKDICDLFLHRWINETDVYRGIYKSDYFSLNDRCKCFVLGSDQLWRAGFVEGTDYFTCLDWVRDSKYKIAYGTSTGVDFYEGSQKDKFTYLLRRINEISVREKSCVLYLKNDLGIDAKQVLDPVFLCDVKKYMDLERMGRIRLPKDKFVAAYMLDIREDLCDVLRHVAHKMTSDNYNLILDTERHFDGDCGNSLTALCEPAVEEWLSSIYNSEFFVTDSFHGVCFAIIFHKQFLVFFGKENWRGYNRIYDLLSEFGLSERIIETFDIEHIDSIIANNIDYDIVQKKLDHKVTDSRQWLMQALFKAKNYNCGMSEADYFKSFLYDDFVKEFSIKMSDNISFITEKLYAEISKNRSYSFFINMKRRESFATADKWGNNKMEIVGWGAGACFMRNIDRIRTMYNLKYVCDKNPQKWGTVINGVECISPKVLSEMGEVCVVIMVDDPGISFQIAEELQQIRIFHYDHVNNWLRTIEGEL